MVVFIIRLLTCKFREKDLVLQEFVLEKEGKYEKI